MLGNDTDVDAGTTLTATLGASPAHGTVALAADGSFTYTPNANFNGTDSFTYTASDGAAASNVATVTITVNAVNDAPVAVNDTATTDEDTAVSGNVLGNDTDVDGHDADGGPGREPGARHGGAGRGRQLHLHAERELQRHRQLHLHGERRRGRLERRDGDDHGHGVNDAPVAVNDTATTDEDTAVSGNVLGNDTDVDAGTTLTATLGASPAHGTVALAADGSFTYTPNADFNGTDSFTYTASDGAAASNVATVTITVNAVNDAPVAVNDSGGDRRRHGGQRQRARQRHGRRRGTTLTATLGASPAHGTVTLAADGSFTYTPNADFNGTDSFTYTASDGAAASNVATVTITVTR